MRTYNEQKEIVRQWAIDWQTEMAEEGDYSASEIAEASEMFAKLGKRYGLLKEFHENGIC